MEDSNNVFKSILTKVQEHLTDTWGKSEIKYSDREAILYGKISDDKNRYTIVVHIKEENYTPESSTYRAIETKESQASKLTMPSLNLPFHKAQNPNCSEEEQLAIKNKFTKEAEQIGKEFLRTMRAGKL